MDTILNRADIAKIIGKDPATGQVDQKLILGLESLRDTTITTAAQTATNVEATTALQDATVITLSPNDALTRERILAVGPGLSITDNGPGNTVVLGLTNIPSIAGPYRVTFNVNSDADLYLPSSGRIPSSSDGPFADDVAAAAGGVQISEWYAKTGGTVAWRVT